MTFEGHFQPKLFTILSSSLARIIRSCSSFQLFLPQLLYISTTNNPLLAKINAPSLLCKKQCLRHHKAPFGQNPPSGQKTSPCAVEMSSITV